MNLMERFLSTCNYRITEGSDYGWQCYPDAHCLDSWNGDQEGHSFTVIFSTKDQTCYELQAHDYKNNRAYRWINPDYKFAHNDEAAHRNVNPVEAWDDLKYVDLELVDDFFEKMAAINNDEDYDTRVSVPLDLEDELLFDLMMRAHERDITLNQMVEEVLRQTIDQLAVKA
jgi:hypothetical protein